MQAPSKNNLEPNFASFADRAHSEIVNILSYLPCRGRALSSVCGEEKSSVNTIKICLLCVECLFHLVSYIYIKCTFSLKTRWHSLCSTKCISKPYFHLTRWLDQLPTSFQKLPEMLTELGVYQRNSEKKIESETLGKIQLNCIYLIQFFTFQTHLCYTLLKQTHLTKRM